MKTKFISYKGQKYVLASTLVIAGDDWGELLDLINNAPHGIIISGILRGVDEFADLNAQVSNGGFEQYISNGYSKRAYEAVNFLAFMGSDKENYEIAKKAIEIIKDINFHRYEIELESEDELERKAAEKRLDKKDESWYKINEKLVAKVLKFVKKALGK